MQWDDPNQIACRICLDLIRAGRPPQKLFDHTTDKPRWTRFLLDSMGLRVPGQCRVPQHLCTQCHHNLSLAFDVFCMAQRSTELVVLKHQQREQQQSLMSRNGDGAASVRPTGRKMYFGDDGEADAEQQCDEEPSSSCGAGAENFEDLAQACLDDGEDDLMMIDTTTVQIKCEPIDMEKIAPDTTNAANADVKIECAAEPRVSQASTAPTTPPVPHPVPDTTVAQSVPKHQPVPTITPPPPPPPALHQQSHVPPRPFVVRIRRAEVVQTLAVPAAGSKDNADFAANRLQDDNRGFQMLQRNGWQPGETIGRNGAGIEEPIMVALKNDRRGLGDTGSRSVDWCNKRFTHPIMHTFMRQYMLQNGQVQTLMFGDDFAPAELQMMRGCAARLRYSVRFTNDGMLCVDTKCPPQNNRRKPQNFRRY